MGALVMSKVVIRTVSIRGAGNEVRTTCVTKSVFLSDDCHRSSLLTCVGLHSAKKGTPPVP
jgi:hypothetical protein